MLTEVKELLQGLQTAAMLQKEYLSLDELALYLAVEKSTVYALTAKKAFAVYNPNGKLKYVKRAEIDAWIEKGRVSSAGEAAAKAGKYLMKKR
jgi:excisionase family DNA binding protein